MPLQDIWRRKNRPVEKVEKSPAKVDEVIVDGDDADGGENHVAGLVTGFGDILRRNVALGYFIQFLESKQQAALIKFWLDVESFQSHRKPKDPQNKGQNLKSITEDAVEIYQRYVAPDCVYPISLSLEEKQGIIQSICSEDGNVDPLCFDATKGRVVHLMETVYYPEFLRSPFYAKHQLEVLSAGVAGLTMRGVLHTDMLLFTFMGFLESNDDSGVGLALVEFWMTVANVRRSSMVKSDAMAVYDKFVSAQSQAALAFSASIRSDIEQTLCRESAGVSPSCFDRATRAVELKLAEKFLVRFIASPRLVKYSAELAAVADSVSAVRTRSISTSSLNTSGSSDAASVSISAQNTLLASASSSRKPSRRKSPDFLERSADPDFLWRRKQTSLTSIGHIDRLGRYTSRLERPPGVVLSENPSMKAKISKAVRRMVTSEEMERLREEMAWQMADMIVTDVTSRTTKVSPSWTCDTI